MKRSGWEVDYFDTYLYEKDIDSTKEKESTGGFKSSGDFFEQERKPLSYLSHDFQKLIDLFEPDLLVATALSNEYEFMMSWLQSIKYPSHMKSIIGGVHATLKPNEIINSGFFDLLCTGEAEETLKEVIDKIKSNSDISAIKGTYFYDRSVTNKVCIVKNERRELLTEEELWQFDPDFEFPRFKQ